MLSFIAFRSLFVWYYEFLITSSPASVSSGSDFLGSSVRFPPSYSVEQYIAHKSAYHEAPRFTGLLQHLERQSNPSINHARDTAAGAWCRRWNNLGGQGTSSFRTANAETETLFVYCTEEVSY